MKMFDRNRNVKVIYHFRCVLMKFKYEDINFQKCQIGHIEYLNFILDSLPNHAGQVKFSLGQVIFTDYLPIGKVTENLSRNVEILMSK